jgi:oligopeptide/dipeptide ABC transporter ATP-binding protein
MMRSNARRDRKAAAVDLGSTPGDDLLRVEGLTVSTTGHDARQLVTDLSFNVAPGEVVALVGESGSGKSTACLAVPRLLAHNLAIAEGRVLFKGRDLAHASEREMRTVRGAEIGIVFQDPLSALDPVRNIGSQLAEARVLHGVESRQQAKAWAADTLGSLGFRNRNDALRSYPSFLSGGMRQRVCVGIAFSGEPSLVIADEPTTSLDVSLQGRLLRLLLSYRDRYRTAIILVSHDVGVVRAVADRVVVMYGGRAVETGPTKAVLSDPVSPYTRALLRAVPALDPAMRGRPLPTIDEGRDRPVSPSGCPFAPRCPNALPKCTDEFPPGSPRPEGGSVWCWNP